MNILYCEFNDEIACVEIIFTDGSMSELMLFQNSFKLGTRLMVEVMNE